MERGRIEALPVVSNHQMRAFFEGEAERELRGLSVPYRVGDGFFREFDELMSAIPLERAARRFALDIERDARGLAEALDAGSQELLYGSVRNLFIAQGGHRDAELLHRVL